mmetsp:Transcript_101319/g.281997  ORF Transcript_101319/g.281997 Transcript_101319/m.281997 type:complete len:211 (+) Transcript_101319:886-1518(+)
MSHQSLHRLANHLVLRALRGPHSRDQRNTGIGHLFEEVNLCRFISDQQACLECGHLQLRTPGLAAPVQHVQQRAGATQTLGTLRLAARVVQRPTNIWSKRVKPSGDILIRHLVRRTVLEVNHEFRPIVCGLRADGHVLVDIEEVPCRLAVVVAANDPWARVLHPLHVEPVGGPVSKLDVKLFALVDGMGARNLHATDTPKSAPPGAEPCL